MKNLEFRRISPPRELLAGESLAHDLERPWERTDHRWRLDAVLAIENYIDE